MLAPAANGAHTYPNPAVLIPELGLRSLGFFAAYEASFLFMQISMPGAPYAVEVVTPVLYGQVPGQPVWEGGLYLDLLLPVPRPSRPLPAVLYLHAGGWSFGDRSFGQYPWHGPVLAAHGYVVASASYRLSSVAPFPAQIFDAKAAVRWLRANAATYGIDPTRVGAWGDSAGGHLAGLLATSSHRAELEGGCGSPGWSSAVEAVVTRCAPTDFRTLPSEDPGTAPILDALFGGPLATTVDLRTLASPAFHATENAASFLIVHGTRDETVPFEQAQTMADTLSKLGVDVTLHAIEGAFHNLRTDIDPPWGSTPWDELGWLALDYFRDKL